MSSKSKSKSKPGRSVLITLVLFSTDVCDPHRHTTVADKSCFTIAKQCSEGQDDHLQLSTGRCDPGRDDASCCTDAAQCSEGEGDCDYDSECAGDLVCGTNNCQLWNPLAKLDYDCCQGKVTTNISWNYCSKLLKNSF